MTRVISVVLAMILINMHPAVQNQEDRGPSRFVGRISWMEIREIDGKPHQYEHIGSCVAIDTGSSKKPELDIPHRTLLTNAHVVGSSKQVFCQIQGKEFMARVVVLDTEQDMAFLLIPSKAGPLESAPRSPLVYQLNKTYTAIGYGHGVLTKIEGTIGDYGKFKMRTDVDSDTGPTYKTIVGMSFKAKLIRGMSGGGIFDEKDRLLGLVAASGEKYSVFIPWGKPIGADKKSRDEPYSIKP